MSDIKFDDSKFDSNQLQAMIEDLCNGLAVAISRKSSNLAVAKILVNLDNKYEMVELFQGMVIISDLMIDLLAHLSKVSHDEALEITMKHIPIAASGVLRYRKIPKVPLEITELTKWVHKLIEITEKLAKDSEQPTNPSQN
jgi:hypothetical protein